MSTPEQIKNFIIEESKSMAEIPGSVIGLRIRRSFPDVDMKRRFGGLSRFIKQYCADDLMWLRKNGGDDIFGHVAAVAKTANSGPVNSERPSQKQFDGTFWTAFSNPNVSCHIFVSKDTGTLTVKESGDALPEPFVPIEKITVDEYRDMASQFLSELSEGQRNDFRQALSLDDFWPHWSAVLWRHKRDGIFDRWIKWRANQIFRLFEQRLTRAELPPNLFDVAIGELKRRPPKYLRIRESRTAIKKVNDSEGRLRLIVHSAIERMGEEELRGIWLPLGTLTDLLK